ncbi:HNH endonuclease (plasmid) [Streptomyces sp. NBC_00335]|uniref:HNH endonuclease signature motif containing protein n=1 Tax=unclassified Streptomyces TaxID=2593676 RepID=UPI00225399FA|nr:MULTISPECIES: HNH endonuclease signature motif containing protein [unclassified Streptomyces]MCX5410153.1 HNH endonuclease [Streptomyces sp. NBC_00086]
MEIDSDGIKRKSAVGPSCVEGWDLLYSKPRDAAEVVRRGRSVSPLEYGLACTIHRTVCEYGSNLIAERPLRRGPRNAWCLECAGNQSQSPDILVAEEARDGDRYRHVCAKLKASERDGRTVERTIVEVYRDPQAVEAVRARAQDKCENPDCGGMPSDKTPDGRAILQVDHIMDLALGGRDYPKNMIALCPNCHAMKTYGSRKEELRRLFKRVAKEAHKKALQRF